MTKRKMVYAYWDSSPTAPPHQAELVVLWRRTWKARGWNPRLLLAKTAARHRGKGSPTYTTLTVMNLSWRPGRIWNERDLLRCPNDANADWVLAAMKARREELSALV